MSTSVRRRYTSRAPRSTKLPVRDRFQEVSRGFWIGGLLYHGQDARVPAPVVPELVVGEERLTDVAHVQRDLTVRVAGIQHLAHLPVGELAEDGLVVLLPLFCVWELEKQKVWANEDAPLAKRSGEILNLIPVPIEGVCSEARPSGLTETFGTARSWSSENAARSYSVLTTGTGRVVFQVRSGRVERPDTCLGVPMRA